MSFSISFQHPFNRAGGRTSNVLKDMAIRTITFLCAASLLASCKDKDEDKDNPTTTGILGTVGPTLGPDGKVLANVVTFEYQLEGPKQVQFVDLDDAASKIEAYGGKLISKSRKYCLREDPSGNRMMLSQTNE
jgi:hypothetical protein